ncbi:MULTISPECIES: MFS transporter [Streptomyces]|uniref:Transmembrane efflux protein n=1 Tax=Streptomyces sviceus (strain ATCC 29083 / DSM 924 / JCM 4929 / NBRC 13980 / NCIMB 11184 / NRRL 5439 / UC 5370) TaxID=463191 RepID=D6XBJ6_STRX2|nr:MULTISPECIES: MFS transporter [Streptomyces]EFH28621.1 transmembrane efflux protein [Streptomyces sviceus ATCC 29083]MYT05686.1 MFS transporter [Streptomyces sp. SID5470]
MTTETTTPRPVRAAAPPELGGLGLFTVLLAAALPLIDFFIVNVALPSIGADLSASESVLELVVAGYGLAYAVLLVLGGRLGDLFGRRRLFLGGMLAFGLTSLACGLAPTAWTLVAARVAQGAASAAMLPQVLATIQSATTGPRRARAMGLYGATAGLAMVAGQILGGVLVAADIAGTSWRATFLVNVPVVLVGLVLAVRTIPETRSRRPEPVDGPGTVLLAATLLALLAPLTEGRAAGWPLWTWLSLAAFPFLAGAFFAVERRADRGGRTPLVPPSLFALVSLRRGLLLILPFSMGFAGFMFVIAVALQEGAGRSPVQAGLALAPLAVTFLLTSIAGPRLISRFGTRVVTAGALIQGVGLGLMILAARSSWPDLGLLPLLPGGAIAGVGQALQLPVVFRIVLSEVPPARAGVGSGVMVTTQQASLALGVATLGTLFLALVPGMGMRDALVTTLLVQLAGVALTGLLSLRLPRVID